VKIRLANGNGGGFIKYRKLKTGFSKGQFEDSVTNRPSAKLIGEFPFLKADPALNIRQWQFGFYISAKIF